MVEFSVDEKQFIRETLEAYGYLQAFNLQRLTMTTTAITEIFGFIFRILRVADFDVNQYHPDQVGGFAYLHGVTGVIMNGH